MKPYLPALIVVVVVALFATCGCLGHYFSGDCDATINVAVFSDSHFTNAISDSNVFQYTVTKTKIDTVTVCDASHQECTESHVEHHYSTVCDQYQQIETCPAGYNLKIPKHGGDYCLQSSNCGGKHQPSCNQVNPIDSNGACITSHQVDTPATVCDEYKTVCDQSHKEQVETVTNSMIVNSVQGTPTEIELGYDTGGQYWRIRWHGRDNHWFEQHWNCPSDENSYVTVTDYQLPGNYVAQTPDGFKLTSDQCGEQINFRYYNAGSCPAVPCGEGYTCTDGQCILIPPTPTPTPTPAPVVCADGYINVDNVCVPKGAGPGSGFGDGDNTQSSGTVMWDQHVATKGTFHGYEWFAQNATAEFITIIRPDGSIAYGPIKVMPFTTSPDIKGGVDTSGGAYQYIDTASNPDNNPGSDWIVILSGTDIENPVTARVLSADKMFVNDAQAGPNEYVDTSPHKATCCHSIYDVWDLRYATLEQIKGYYAANPGVVSISYVMKDCGKVQVTGEFCVPSGNCILIQ